MANTSENANLCGLNRKDFQTTINGKKTDLYILKNRKGYEVAISNYGGAIVSIMVPDKDGNVANVIQGHANIQQLMSGEEPYLSTLIGRWGNRICKGQFTLNGKDYQLALNDGPNHLHGGAKGFNCKVWDARQMGPRSLALHRVSSYGEEGYTGEINADFYLPTDETAIPTGEILKVEGTPFDFRTPKALGKDIDADNQQIKFGKGFDHNYVLNKKEEGELSFAARITEPKSGRTLECYTTEPGMQLYTANYACGYKGVGGATFPRRSAVCLETQHFPDSPNRPYFPSVVLNPGEQYKQKTIYRFGVVD